LVFSGSIGRTDLPGGDYDTIISSLERVILPLADDVRLHPGHGPSTTVAVERRFNPFLQGLRPQENRSGPL
jgi:glyoxylase-like metal-dependent hydrolase (beta-lactamase superfamily II)